MTRILRLVALVALATLATLATLALPGFATASPVREYQLQYSPVGEAEHSMLIVTAIIDPGASLPTSVTVPVPAGAALLWSGELLGGDPMADPFREATRESAGDMDLYTFTVFETRLAQVEVSIGSPTFSGNRVSGTLTWTNPGDEVLVSASLIAEPGATDVKTNPAVTGAMQTNSIGETLHPMGSVRLVQGGSYVMEGSWRRGGAGAGDSMVLPILIGVLVVAVLALVVVIARERTRARRAAAADEV
jgi:hypothetical protein